MSTALVVHGHFYQPPRENPWTASSSARTRRARTTTGTSASPPSATAQRASRASSTTHGRIDGIVNNYELMSLQLRPDAAVLAGARTRPTTYAAHPRGRPRSVAARGGHGNAIAQAYNHAILPLCNERDRRTQVRWGMADFEHRFGRAAGGDVAARDGVQRRRRWGR